MKKLLTLLLLSLSFSCFAVVENCHRTAEIMGGIVNHHWLKTDTKIAGMGSGVVEGLIGDRFEAPYATLVYIIDHSLQEAKSCKEIKDIDEDCVNAELDIGKPLGRFNLFNNCQSFVTRVLKKCSTKANDPYENRELYSN